MKPAVTLVGCLVLAMAVLASVVFGQAQTQMKTQEPETKPECDCTELQLANARLDVLEKRLRDWPDLTHYREANTKIAAPVKEEQRVVFMGDSITEMWVLPKFGAFFPGKPYIGRGIGGQTTPQMVLRFRADVIALQPKVVVILAGTNDLAGNTGPITLEETEGNLATMAELARVNGIRVVLSSVLPVSNYGHDRDGNPLDVRVKRPPEKILELNEWIRKYAAVNGHVYLNYFPAMADEHGLLKKELSEDGLHPNSAGYGVMAPLAEKAIQSALREIPAASWSLQTPVPVARQTAEEQIRERYGLYYPDTDFGGEGSAETGLVISPHPIPSRRRELGRPCPRYATIHSRTTNLTVGEWCARV